MKQAHEVVLHPNELNILHRSMSSVHYAVRDRVSKLQGEYSQHCYVIPVVDCNYSDL